MAADRTIGSPRVAALDFAPSLQLRHLHTFVTIIESGTLTAAAERLFKTQGAVSHDLKALERALGVQVIDRDGQRIKLTEAGRELLPHAAELLGRVAAAELAIQRLRTGARRTVRVGTLPSLARDLVRPLALFRRQEPETAVSLFTAPSERLTEALVAGDLDLILSEPAAQDGVGSLSIGSEQFLVSLPASDPLADRSRLSAEALSRHPFIGYNRVLETPRLTQRFFAIVGRYVEPVVEVSEFWVILELIRAEVGYSLLPASALVGVEGIAGVVPEPRLEREIAMSWNARGRQDRAVVRFRDLAVSELGEAHGRG